MDVKAAFDSVWVNGLKHKIRKIGLPIQLEKILFSFICRKIRRFFAHFCRTHRVPTLLWLSRSPSPSPPSSPSATKPISIKTSIFSWFEHHIQHIIHPRKEDSARVHLVTTETKTKTHTKTNTKTKTRTFKSKSSCIYKLICSVL